MEHPLEGIIAWLEAGAEADYQAGVLLLQQHCRNRSLVNNLLKKDSEANRAKLVYELVKVGCGGRMEDVSEVLTHFAQAVQGATPTPVQQVADVLTGQDFPAQPSPEPDQVPEHVRAEVDELTQLMSRLHNQRCQLSNRLADGGPSEPELVGEILSLQQQYNALAEKRRRVLARPAAPAASPAEQLGIAPDQAEAFDEAVDQAANQLGDTAPDAELPAAAPEGEQGEQGEPAPVLDRGELVKQRNTLRSNISKNKKKALEAKTEEKRSEYAQKVGKLEVELGVVDMQLALPQA